LEKLQIHLEKMNRKRKEKKENKKEQNERKKRKTSIYIKIKWHHFI